MQDYLNEFQSLFRNKTFILQNKHLQTILNSIFFFLITITKFQNESKIIIIDEYNDKDKNKYFFFYLL